LDINEGACGGTSPRQWNVETKTATEAIEQSQENKADRQADQAEQKRAAQLEIDRKAMVRVLVKTKNGETKSALKDRLGIKQGRLDATIASLLDDETIVACEITRANKQTYDAFKINEAKHSDDNQ
jgi:hypothetical protein